MRRTRVKICGLTRLEDVAAAAKAGADALGFVFAPRSPRRLDATRARILAAASPAFVSSVGLFQDQDAQAVANILDQVPLSLLQFHGSESADFCSQFGLPYIKAVSMGQDGALEEAEGEFCGAAGLLLDSHAPGEPGGTGATFDWSRIHDCVLPVIIAGGLTPHNVFQAVRDHRPWGVDVSSGVESRPGIKDGGRISTFIEEVTRGDRDNS